MRFWPSDAFQRGVASTVAVFTVIGGIAGSLGGMIYLLKDEQRSKIEAELSSMTTRATELDKQLTDLVNQKWREKYEAEHLQVETLTEQAKVLNKQHDEQVDELNAKLQTVQSPDTASLSSSNSKLKHDNEVLNEKLRLANTELDRLRKAHTERPVELSPSGNLDKLKSLIDGRNPIVVKRGEGWSSQDGVATFGVITIRVSLAMPGKAASHSADVKVFGDLQKAQAGSSYSKEINGKVYRINVTGINPTDQTVAIAYVGPQIGN